MNVVRVGEESFSLLQDNSVLVGSRRMIMTKNTSSRSSRSTRRSRARARNIDKALNILRGKTVLAHDRRKPDAHAIEFKSYRRTGKRVVSPVYGVSNTVHLTLMRLADRTTYESGMPHYHFAL